MGCWAPGQGALASVALDFHARHWVPPACYLSALKYPAFGHSVLKITSVGAVLFSQLIRELYACNEVFQLPPGGRAAAGFVFHGVPAVRSCVIQSLIDTAQNGENAFWQVVLCPSNSGSCSDCAVLCHCSHGSRLLPRTFRYPGSRSCCGISGTGPVYPSRASPSNTPCLYCCLG